MKRLLILLSVLLVGLFATAQSPYTGLTGYAVKQSLGSDSAIVQGKGALSGRIVIYNFADTTTANTQRIKNYPGALIFTTDSSRLWLRNKFASAWGGLASTSGSQIISIDIFSDSSWVICYSDGSCDTIDVNNQAFVTINNLFGGCNNLLSGGIVTANDPANSLVFDVTAADYTIGCVAYHTDATQITLNDGDATFDRFDVVIVDTNEVVSVIEGTPSADPQVPQINHASQLALTTFLVPAGATTGDDLGITLTVIYDENLQQAGGEWDTDADDWTVDFDNTSFPAHLTKDAFFSGSTVSTSDITFSTTDTMRNGQFDVLKFYVRLSGLWNADQGLDISFYNGTTKVTNSVIMMNNSFGFNITTTASYQVIAIPMAQFVFSDSIFFSLQIKPLASPFFVPQEFRIDWIQLQGGINQLLGGSSGLYIWNQYSVPQPANWWVAGNARLEGNFQSPQRITPTTFYSGSLKIGAQAIANGVEATVFGEYARGTGTYAIAIGSQASGSGVIVSPYGTSNSSTNVNIGGLAVAGTGNVQVGVSGAITGNDNVKIGESGTVAGARNVNIGYNIGHSFSNTISLGYQASPTQANQFIIPSTITNVRWGAFGDGSITGTPTYLAAWDVDGNFIEYPPGGISGGLLIDADNGLSVRSATTAVLGQNEAEGGNPAILLSNREIPMGGFYLTLNASAAQAGNILQTKNSSAAVRARVTSAASFSNTGGQTGSEIFGDGATVSSTNSVVIGNTAVGSGSDVTIGQAASSGSGGSRVVIGASATAVGANPGEVIIGTQATSTNAAGGTNVLIGTQATTNGGGLVAVGYALNVSGTNSVGIGNQVVIGSTHAYSQAYGAFTTTTAANQVVFGSSSGAAEGVNDVYIGRGVTSTTANNLKIQTTGASGTNMAGNTLTIAGSPGTGNATPGVIIFQTSTVGASGTTLQSLANKIQINGSGILAYDGVMPTSGSGGTDSAIFRNSSTGQYYLAPGSAVITADDGLTKNTATNVQLFGPVGTPAELLSSRYLDEDGFSLFISGTTENSNVVISNTGIGGTALTAAGGAPGIGVSTSGNYGVSASGTTAGVYTTSTTGIALDAALSGTSGGLAGKFTVQPSATNTVVTVMEVNRNVQLAGVGADGVGGSIDFKLETSTTADVLSNQIISKWTTAANATRTSSLTFTGVLSASTVDLLTLAGDGSIKLRPITATAASAITPAEGMLVFVSDTDATFTSIGFWGYENGAWAKL